MSRAAPNDRASAAPAASCTPDPRTVHCITCADEGREGRVIALLADGFASVAVDGAVEQIAMDLLAEVAIGDRVLVHAGVALTRLSE